MFLKFGVIKIFPRYYIHSRQCSRCGLQFNKREDTCPHCKNLTNPEALKLKGDLQEENSELGKNFIYLCVGILLLLIILIV